MALTVPASGAPVASAVSRAAMKLPWAAEPLGTVTRTAEGRRSSDSLRSSGPFRPQR
jgi:hypothetical protein